MNDQSVQAIRQRANENAVLWAMHDSHPWRCPTIRELQKALGWKSRNTVWQSIQRLRRQGLVVGYQALTATGWRAGARTAHPARTVAFVTSGGVRRIGIAEPVVPWPPEIVSVWL